MRDWGLRLVGLEGSGLQVTGSSTEGGFSFKDVCFCVP